MDRKDFVLNNIQEKKDSKFNGAVKFGIEHGAIVSVGESNHFDAVTYENAERLSLALFISSCLKPSFNGTIIFKFESGKLTGYAYSRTFKGDDLKRLMEL